MAYQEFEVKKRFSDIWNELEGREIDGLGDIKLAAFILQHWFTAEPVSAAWIGTPDLSEFLAVSALVEPSASVVVLGTDLSPEYRSRLNDLADLLGRYGLPAQVQIADLTLRGRWSKLLPALSAKHVGVLGVDARWTLSEPLFWNELGNLVRESRSVLYIRGALDFRQPDVSIRLLRSMGADAGVTPIAATPSSLWFAPEGDAAALAEALQSCSLFEPCAHAEDAADGLVTSIAYNDWTPYFIGGEGRVIRKLYQCNQGPELGIEFGSGWFDAEPDGRWTDGEEAAATLTLPRGVATASGLTVRGNAWVSPGGEPQRIGFGVGVSPKKWTELEFDDNAEIKTCELQLEPSDAGQGEITLQIKVAAPSRPSDFGEPDSRMLGFKLRTFSLLT
jgi:hypothetical protein